MRRCSLTVSNWQRIYSTVAGLNAVAKTLLTELEERDTSEDLGGNQVSTQGGEEIGLAVAAISLSEFLLELIGEMDSDGMRHCLLEDKNLRRFPPTPGDEVWAIFQSAWGKVLREAEARETLPGLSATT